MSQHLTTSGGLNLLGIGPEAVSGIVSGLRSNGQIVTIEVIARELNVSQDFARRLVSQASQAGLVRHIPGKGWLPPSEG